MNSFFSVTRNNSEMLLRPSHYPSNMSQQVPFAFQSASRTSKLRGKNLKWTSIHPVMAGIDELSSWKARTDFKNNCRKSSLTICQHLKWSLDLQLLFMTCCMAGTQNSALVFLNSFLSSYLCIRSRFTLTFWTISVHLCITSNIYG